MDFISSSINNNSSIMSNNINSNNNIVAAVAAALRCPCNVFALLMLLLLQGDALPQVFVVEDLHISLSPI